MRGVRLRLAGSRAELERRLPVIAGVTQRLLSANVIDASFRLAAQAFLTAMPLLFTAAAFAPHGARDQLLSSVRSVFGLDDTTAAQLRQALDADSDTLRQTAGAVSAVVALLSATSLSRALARICERAWALPKAPTRISAWRWLLWISTWVATMFFQGSVRDGFGVGSWLGAITGFLAGCLLWSWTEHLLLAGRESWLAVLPGAALAAGATTALALTARLYMPVAIHRSLDEYGPLGAVFSLLSWLLVVCMALTVAITAGAVIAEHPPLRRYIMAEAPE